MGIDREPVGWLSLDDLQRFCCHFETLTFEIGRLPPPPPLPLAALRTFTSVSPLPSPQPPLYSSGLATLKEGEEATAETFTKPISVDVEGGAVQTLEKAPSPVRCSPMGFKAVEDGDDDEEDEEEMCPNIRIQQVCKPCLNLPISDSVLCRLFRFCSYSDSVICTPPYLGSLHFYSKLSHL